VFLERLRVAGVVVRERRDPDGRLSGYAVGRRESAGETVLFGGGKLAADLSLPRLLALARSRRRRRRRSSRAGGGRAGGPGGAVEQASAAATQATEEVRLLIDTATNGASVDTGDAAAAVAEVLAGASRLIEGDTGGPLTQAARDYDRAARESRGRPSTSTAGGSALRAAALADGPGRPPSRAVRGGASGAPGRPGRAAVGLDRAATRGPRPSGAGRGGPAGSVHDRAGQRPLDPPGPRGGGGRARAARARTHDERGCVDEDHGRSQAAAERPGATWPWPLNPRRTHRSPRPKNVPGLALSRSTPG